MGLDGFVKGSAIALGATALFPPLAPLAVAGIVAGAGLTAASTPFRTPNVPGGYQPSVQPAYQHPHIQRSVLTR